MTAKEMMDFLKQMSNKERNLFLDELYDQYFDKGIPVEQIEEEIKILEAYYEGELVHARN